MTDISWSIVSHTNVGKTSLARTLLREEVGEVADQAHVTDRSEQHVLLEAGDDRLLLWDTPGFGDSARLLRRLRGQESPLGWLLSQVWDRIADRPLWCDQQAIANVRDEADLVLYLVSATESPEEAGYVPLEMELIGWTGVPVVVLLNQIGEADGDELARTTAAWEVASRDWPAVRAVLPLDAHRRSWIEEGILLEDSLGWIDAERRPAAERLLEAWRVRARALIDESVTALAECLAGVLHHRESLEGSTFSPGAKRAARERIIAEVEERTRALLTRLIAAHGLAGSLAERIGTDWDHFVDSGELWLDAKKLGLGGALGGAATGALIDAKLLGLAGGAATLIGGVLGGLAGWGLGGWIAEKTTRGRHLRIGAEAIELLLGRLLVGWMGITHHGRGRGEVSAETLAGRWAEEVRRALEAERRTLAKAWERGGEGGPDVASETARRLAPPLGRMVRALLGSASPRAAETVAHLRG